MSHYFSTDESPSLLIFYFMYDNLILILIRFYIVLIIFIL